MKEDVPKRIKARLNTLADLAFEREWVRELTPLAARFDDWQAGQITAGELNDLIHPYHNGPSRDLFKFYSYGESHFAVARRSRRGSVDREKDSQRRLALYRGDGPVLSRSSGRSEDVTP